MDFKTATLTKHTNLTYDVFELAFKAEDTNFLYEAGQFITIKVPQPEEESLLMRSYSISSKPKPGHFELCIKQVENGRGSGYLNSLKPGEKISFLGPLGHFTFKSEPSSQILFVATGTGIASIKSIIEDGLAKGNQQKMHLLFGVRYIKDIFYKEFFEKLSKEHVNFTFELTLSRPEDESWAKSGGKIGRVTDSLKTLELDPKTTTAYICGLKDMVEETTKILIGKGVPKEQVHFERFN